MQPFDGFLFFLLILYLSSFTLDLIALKEKRQELNVMEEKDHDFMTGEKSTQTKKNSLKKRAQTIICTSSVTCKLCGRPFGCKASLKKHMRYYSGKTTHKCKVCGKSFIREGNLYLHLNSSLEWNPFACPQCEKCVFQKKDVTRCSTSLV